MDALAGLLDGPRARGAFLCRVAMDPPWAVRVRDRAPLSLVAPRRGAAWVVPDEGEPRRVPVGGAALMRGPAPYTFADAPGTAPQVFIEPGEHCTTPRGEPLSDVLGLGVRLWGSRADAHARLLVGTYRMGAQIGHRLLSALPPVAVLDERAWSAPLLGDIDAELDRDEPGQDVVLDRLLDLLVISALRSWFADPQRAVPGWYRAQSDAVAGPALRLLHESPERAWTVADLAAAAGVSRATLARRFTEAVGEPPMAYLTGWRLELAAQLLRDPEATVTAVARRVGYATPFALSAAFKRVHGISPAQHRVGAASAGP
ncbi:AraC family transcriptional regulator [Streptomonospora wellingtoniae]|uniref:AraC family transcriptional regulator n=1 Tax=Streptomonospora wellingtoniae TaxID=3075544 RepID=A0ABU2KWP4_9ACTN|nr:AraC family transcriptional regulator [Streptomonospora sp. DSM 45055]MDT0303722.1 AraC family transcriptional regulator [Streptomonospora sp. DSM 45055]